jgi:hypothetical protein
LIKIDISHDGLPYFGIQVYLRYAALTTRPDFIQFVHTIIFFTLPFETARTRCKFGLKRRLVTLWA